MVRLKKRKRPTLENSIDEYKDIIIRMRVELNRLVTKTDEKSFKYGKQL